MRLFPHFLFRSTGFPIEPLEDLACHGAAERLDRALDGEEKAGVQGEAFLARVRESVSCGEARGALSAAARRVRRRRPLSPDLLVRLEAEGWGVEAALLAGRERLLAAAEAERVAAEEALGEEMVAVRRNLARVVADERFREAVLLSSPGALEGLERSFLGGKRRRQAEWKALLYLQRFCSKNDTISFFGPISWGRFDPAGAPLELTWQGEGLTSRRVFLEHWMVDRLAAAMEADPRLTPQLVWRVVYPYEWDAAEGRLWCDLVMSGRRERPADPLARALLTALAAGAPASAAQAGAAVDCRSGAAAVEAAFARLRREGIVRALEVPFESMDPLGDLAAALLSAAPVGAARRRWERRLRVLAALGERLTTADFAARRHLVRRLEERFTAWTGDAARRHGGRTYAGRNLFYEECTRHPERFVLGGAVAADLEADLAKVLEVQAALLEVVAPYGRRRFEEIHRQLSPEGAPVPLSRFLRTLWRRIGGGYLEARLVDPADEDELLRRAEAVLDFRETSDGRLAVAARDPAAAARAALSRRPVVLAADVMLAAAGPQALETGDYEVVVGEVQYFPVGYPEYLWNFHPRREEFRRDYQRWIVAPRVTSRRIARLELEPEATRLVRLGEPLADYVLVDGRGRSFAAGRDQRRITDLTVQAGSFARGPEGGMEEGIVVTGRDGEAFVLANPHHDLFLDAAWKLLVALFRRKAAAVETAGGAVPELVTGRRTVLLRRTWTLDRHEVVEAFAGGADAWRRQPLGTFERLQRLRRRRRLPRHVFARVSGEVKPVHVDFASPLSLANLARLVGVEGRPLELSEMRPGPESLWLRNGGGRHTSEMRVFLA
jgi:hypothetical protein